MFHIHQHILNVSYTPAYTEGLESLQAS